MRPFPQSFFSEKDRIIRSTNEACAARLTTFLGESKDRAYFIGSGLSRPDYPSWQELVLRMREYFEIHHGSIPANIPTAEPDIAKKSSRELQDIFQAFRDHSPNRYVDCIKALFHDRQPSRHNDCTTRIVKTRPSLIATLNYDVSIEAAASTCSIPCTPRFFPTIGFIAQEEDNRPVVMHLHGMFHPDLYADPDLIALHTSGYKRFYGNGSIFNLFGEIFFGRDVIFLGTQLSEPEMIGFFEGLQKYFAEPGRQRSRKAIAIVESKSDIIAPSINGIDQMNELLRQETSSDETYEQTMGIGRVRFFKKDELYSGLTNVLRIAFGDSIISPPPPPPWLNAF